VRLLLLSFSLSLAGCYLAHERDAHGDASAPGLDAAPPHVGVCTHLVAGPTVLLEGPGGVTPRLVALDGGEVGVAYVNAGGGDPTAVYYERLDARLTRLTGPVLAATDSWTWAEPARSGDGIALAFGSTADAPSVLAFFDLDGHVAGPRRSVTLPHPEVLRRSSNGLFWLAFDSRDDGNVLVMAHVRSDGTLVHAAQRIALGRYGSGFGVAARPDGSGQVLSYPSEGPPGVRRGRVNAITIDGSLTGEQTLSMDGADAAIPVFVGGELEVVYRTDDHVRIATLDARTLAWQSETEIARLEGSLLAGTVAGLFVVGSFRAPVLHVLDRLDDAAAIDITAPSPGTGGSISWVTFPDAIVVAVSLTFGSEATPWLARLDCAE
jgi:hypothetical protein